MFQRRRRVRADFISMRSFVVILAALACSRPAVPQSALNLTPSRVVGQPAVQFRSGSPNVTEGRELLTPQGVVVDRTSSPPALYVSDTGNNRVLGWRDMNSLVNGQKADLVLGQVDFSSTVPLGPGTARSGGLSSPGPLAVDRDGNLYVVDTGNNRILRFRKPFASSDEIQFPDFVIGQANFNTDTPNLGGFPTDKTIAIATGGRASRTGLAFDGQGNLWFTDSLNNRILRYPAAALNGPNQPAADIVIGQRDFTTSTPAPATLPAAEGGQRAALLNKNALRAPNAITFDSDGRLYISDELRRVLVYQPPLSTGRDAVRVLGLMVTQPNTAPRREYLLALPQGLFAVGNRLGVVDAGQNRIVLYPPASEWPAESDEFPSPAATTVIGQDSFALFSANKGQPEPTGASLFAPFDAHYSGNELVVADTFNHRVLIFPQTTTGAAATRVLGQTAFNFNGANLVEGRELYLFQGTGAEGGGVALDSRSNPPRLYIADTFNNRVLGYADARRVRPGDRADLVIGQNDLNRTLVNAPSNNSESLTESGLNRPTGLVVDREGNLYVADTGNGRVLRFPSPFAQRIEPGERHRANLVIGQANFNQRIPDPSARNLGLPYGLALTVDEHLLVSDIGHHRVLFFRRGSNGQFTNGQAAERVIGQPDFFTVGAGNAPNRLNTPKHLSLDTDDRLYLADSGNNRVLVYDRITVAANDPSPAFTLTSGLSAPHAVYVSPVTGEVWVANTRGNRATRFPRYEQLAFSNRSDYDIPSSAPLALTQDPLGNLYIAEAVNRVAIHFNALTHQIAGNYSDRPLSPGAIGIIYPAGTGLQFASGTTVFSTLPLPRELDDVQVLVNEVPAPLYFVSPTQINFLVPMNAPSNGTAEVQVMRRSTGQILAVSERPFQPASPALFVQGGALEGQLAAINEDGSINGPGNRAKRGTIVQLFGTGQGFVPNAPPDGEAATGPLETPEKPRVIIGGPDFIAEENVIYSGLAPGLVGVWQINVRIPQTVAPSAAVDTVIFFRNISSNRTTGNRIIRTTIAVDP
jgi:uncharacterized protein (TIGR03437 family)